MFTSHPMAMYFESKKGRWNVGLITYTHMCRSAIRIACRLRMYLVRCPFHSSNRRFLYVFWLFLSHQSDTRVEWKKMHFIREYTIYVRWSLRCLSIPIYALPNVFFFLLSTNRFSRDSSTSHDMTDHIQAQTQAKQSDPSARTVSTFVQITRNSFNIYRINSFITFCPSIFNLSHLEKH